MRIVEGRKCVTCTMEEASQLSIHSTTVTVYTLQYCLFKNICDNQVTQCNNGILNSNKHRDVKGFWCFGVCVLAGERIIILFLILRYSHNKPCG